MNHLNQIAALDRDQAFESLSNRYKRYIVQVLAQHLPLEDVKEALNDVMVRLYRNIDKIDGSLSDHEQRNYISRIVRNIAMDYGRKASRCVAQVPTTDEQGQEREFESVADPDGSVADAERVTDRLAEAMPNLEAIKGPFLEKARRELRVVLQVLQEGGPPDKNKGLFFEAIGRELGVSQGTVQNYWSKAVGHFLEVVWELFPFQEHDQLSNPEELFLCWANHCRLAASIEAQMGRELSKVAQSSHRPLVGATS